MQKVGLAVLAVLFVTISGKAQEAPKAEVFAGYSYARVDADITHVNANGWNFSVAGNVNKWFGLVGDFSGHYGSLFDINGSVHSFGFGPRFSSRKNERVTPFFHTLFGAAHRRFAGFNETAFAMAIGGGIDVRASDHVAVRLIQADYVPTRFGGETQSNARVSVGFVFRLGKK